MTRPTKYGNVKISVNRETGLCHRPDKANDNVFNLDSQLEMAVYQALIKDVCWRNIDRGVSIRIADPSPSAPRGLRLIPDFILHFPDKCGNDPNLPIPYLYVEVKGSPTLEWQRKMKMLRELKPIQYHRYLLVSPNLALMPQDLPCVHPDKIRDFIRAYIAYPGSYTQFLCKRSLGLA